MWKRNTSSRCIDLYTTCLFSPVNSQSVDGLPLYWYYVPLIALPYILWYKRKADLERTKMFENHFVCRKCSGKMCSLPLFNRTSNKAELYFTIFFFVNSNGILKLELYFVAIRCTSDIIYQISFSDLQLITE